MANYIQVEPMATCLDCGKVFCLDCHTQCPYCHPPESVTTTHPSLDKTVTASDDVYVIPYKITRVD